ncbi:MAG TPA: hypothetical protein VIY56_01995, partial [Vicinamibacterales bacterium]
MGLVRTHPRVRSAKRWERARKVGGFYPGQLTKITAWLRNASSTQGAGEWSSYVDVLHSNPTTNNAARRPAVSTSANGLPTSTYATNDCASWPIVAGQNYATATPFGVAFWMNPAAFVVASIYTVGNGTGGASVRAFEFNTDTSQRM